MMTRKLMSQNGMMASFLVYNTLDARKIQLLPLTTTGCLLLQDKNIKVNCYKKKKKKKLGIKK
jgi:hypothetical protein